MNGATHLLSNKKSLSYKRSNRHITIGENRPLLKKESAHYKRSNQHIMKETICVKGANNILRKDQSTYYQNRNPHLMIKGGK